MILMEKTGDDGLPTAQWKNFGDVFSHFDTISEHYRRADSEWVSSFLTQHTEGHFFAIKLYGDLKMDRCRIGMYDTYLPCCGYRQMTEGLVSSK